MADLPYLDENSDLHVTAAMAHDIHEAACTATSTGGLLDQVERILGPERWPDIWRRVQSRPAANPTIFGMRIVMEPEPVPPVEPE